MRPAVSPNLTDHRPRAARLGVVVVAAMLACVTAQGQGLRPLTQQSIGTARPPAPPAAPGSSPTGQTPADFIVAVVNSDPITNSEVRREARRLAQQLAQARQPQPAQAELLRLALDQLITDRALLQVARDAGIRIDDLAVDQAEQSVARQNQWDVAELRRRVQADGMGLVQYREQLRNQLSQIRLREREVDSRVRVTDLEVDQAIQARQSSADGAQELNLAQILIPIPESATAEQLAAAQERARQALTRARANEDFAALVRELSGAADRANGGELGLRTSDRYPPLFVEAVRNVPAGGVADVVQSGAGLHILKVIEKRLAGMAVPQTRARHILLRPTEQLTAVQARDKLLDFKRRIESGQATFADLARENSQDGSAAQGGDLGWAVPGQYVPEFEEAMNALLPGQISDPLVSRFGLHLIQVQQRRTATLEPREQRELVRNQLRDKKMDEAYNVWMAEARGRAYVERREPPQF